MVINKAVETVSTRLQIIFIRLGARAKRAEIMDERPRTDAIFSGHEMTMKVMTGNEIAIHKAHMAVDNIAGAVSRRAGISAGKSIILEAQLED